MRSLCISEVIDVIVWCYTMKVGLVTMLKRQATKILAELNRSKERPAYREVSPCRVFCREQGRTVNILHVMRSEMELRTFFLEEREALT